MRNNVNAITRNNVIKTNKVTIIRNTVAIVRYKVTITGRKKKSHL